MIVREREHDFIMIRQHDHAFLSGEIARHIQKDLFKGENLLNDVRLAISQHDRSWIALDDTPIWNDRSNAPYSFMDYPLLPRLALYRAGLDEISEMNLYACLLCSMHFSSFFTSTLQKECAAFLNYERERQRSIKQQLAGINEDVLIHHFRLLQLCDRFSLYISLNEPGASKENEHPWYRNGFNQSDVFSVERKPIVFSWITDRKIRADSFVFEHEFSVNLKYKSVLKQSVRTLGIDRAYKEAELLIQEVEFCK